MPFEQKKFDYLKKIINEADQIIINGDFFDDYMISFDDFIKSPWNQLFPMLKEKKAVCVFGNHDRQKFSDKRLSLFSDLQSSEYRLPIADYNLVFTHGQQFRKTADLFITKSFKPFVSLVIRVAHICRQIMVNIFEKQSERVVIGKSNHIVN